MRVGHLWIGICLASPVLTAAWKFGGPRAAALGGLFLVVELLLAARGRVEWLAIGAGAALLAVFSPPVGLWFLVVSAAMAMSVSRRGLVGHRHRWLFAVGLLTGSALATWRTAQGAWLSATVLSGLMCLTVVGATVAPGAAVRVVDAVRSAAGLVARWLLFGVLVVPVVLVPWVLDRLAALDPLWSPGRWSTRSGRSPNATAPWAPGGHSLPRSMRWRRAGVLLGGLALVVLALAVWPEDPDVEVPPAFAESPWYPEYLEDINWVWSTDVAFDPLSPVRVRDVSTRHVNVEDGRRRTWEPDCSGCEPVVVWVYGGSTTFGLGQRDHHTVPSELARLAWRSGIALEVHNRGVPGDAHWEEAQRFAWDLANEPAPDLVVFYDGVNEMRSLEFVEGGPPRPVSFVKENFWRQYLDLTGERGVAIAESLVGRRPQGEPPGAAEVEERPVPDLDAKGWGELAAQRYESSRRTSLVLAEAYGVEHAYFWQPGLEHREQVQGEPTMDGRTDAELRSAAAVSGLPAEVVDLTGVFDGTEDPVFYDSNHTNELGARMVAEALFEHLEPTLTELAELRRQDAPT